MRIGIGLGAGGAFGWAFHLGVLDGLRATGRTPENAVRVIGTSAGSSIAVSMLSGATTEEVLATVGPPTDAAERADMEQAFADVLRRPWRILRPIAPLGATAWRPGRGLPAIAGAFPTGAFPTSPLRRFPGAEAMAEWPDSLWIPSVRADDGQLVVFGRDRKDVPVVDAMEASSAVPGMFHTKMVEGRPHVDGAVASALHANLFLDDGLDAILLSSPMTKPGNGMVRRRARRQLDAEVELLRNAGTHVLAIEPDEHVMELAKGFPRANADAGIQIAAAAADMVVDAFAALGAD